MGVPVDAENYWLFGYGSLIFKAPPHVVERVPGYVTGCVRRFWQASNDHRGTPAAPGRVVTLITKAHWLTLDDPHAYGSDDVVHGVAYRIDPRHAREVKEYMDWREKHGYVDILVDFHAMAGTGADADADAAWPCVCYVGTPGNEAFVGPEDPEELAQRIARSRGPSGANIDYLTRLDAAVLELCGTRDPHVADLVTRAQKYLDAAP